MSKTKTMLPRFLAVVMVAANAISAASGAAGVVKVSSLGWDAEDSTRFLQAALDSGAATVVVDKVEGPWVTRPLFARSNQTVVFEGGVELVAKKGEFLSVNDCLFRCEGVSNVVIRGYGATWRMHRADYAAPPYKKGQWRHTLSIVGSDNVTAEGLTLLESGGDGVYVGCYAGKARAPRTSTDIVLRDLVCDRHYRQGMSVISANRLLIERCAMRNTRGTAPQAGIDFEPNYANEELTDIVMRDCEIADNEGDGIDLSLLMLDGTSKPVSIAVEGCRFRGNYRSAVFSSWTKPTFPAGSVKFRDCTFADAREEAVYIIRKPLAAYSLEFSKCAFVNAHTRAKDEATVTDVMLLPRNWNDDTTDGVRFNDCVVVQPVAREWISTTTPSLVGGPVKAVTGAVTVKSPDGERKFVLDESWRKGHFHPVAPRGLPDYRPFDAAAERRDGAEARDAPNALPEAMAQLEPMNVRHKAAYRLYAAAPGRVRIAGRQHLLGGRTTPSKARMSVTNAGGVEIASFPIFAESEAEIAFDVPAAGFYLLSMPVPGNAVRLCAANVPVAIEVPEEGVNLIYSAGRLRFRKEAGMRATLAIKGSLPERIDATIRDPDGREVWTRRAIGEWTAFEADAGDAAGIWTLELAPSAAAPFEDCTVLVRGIAPELFLVEPRRANDVD